MFTDKTLVLFSTYNKQKVQVYVLSKISFKKIRYTSVFISLNDNGENRASQGFDFYVKFTKGTSR